MGKSSRTGIVSPLLDELTEFENKKVFYLTIAGSFCTSVDELFTRLVCLFALQAGRIEDVMLCLKSPETLKYEGIYQCISSKSFFLLPCM